MIGPEPTTITFLMLVSFGINPQSPVSTEAGGRRLLLIRNPINSDGKPRDPREQRDAVRRRYHVGVALRPPALFVAFVQDHDRSRARPETLHRLPVVAELRDHRNRHEPVVQAEARGHVSYQNG